MKKSLMVFFAIILLFGTSGMASAATYEFEDTIDSWGILNVDAAYISEQSLGIIGGPLEYTHDLTDDVDFASGDVITEAYLQLDFTNDFTDAQHNDWLLKWDKTETASYALDGSDLIEIGEVDNGQHDMVIDVDWLNDDGELDVTVVVHNDLGTATAWLDHSKVYGTATTVPIPGAVWLLGSGLIGLLGIRKKVRR